MGNWVTTLIETQLKDNEEGFEKKKGTSSELLSRCTSKKRCWRRHARLEENEEAKRKQKREKTETFLADLFSEFPLNAEARHGVQVDLSPRMDGSSRQSFLSFFFFFSYNNDKHNLLKKPPTPQKKVKFFTQKQEQKKKIYRRALKRGKTEQENE